MTTDRDGSAPMLPGLDGPTVAGAGSWPLVTAVRRTIAELDRLGLLGEHHAAACQLALDLAASIGSATRTGKASAAAMAAAQLRETLASLPNPDDQEGDTEDAWDQLARELRDAAHTGPDQ